MNETKEANERETTYEYPADHHPEHQPAGLAEGNEEQGSRRREEIGEGNESLPAHGRKRRKKDEREKMERTGSVF